DAAPVHSPGAPGQSRPAALDGDAKMTPTDLRAHPVSGLTSGRPVSARNEVAASRRPARAGDAFVLHPTGRPDVALALTGQDLLRLKVLLDGVAGASDRDEVVAAAATIAARLARYFAGLK